MSDKNYVAICSNCGKALEICRDNFPEELKYEAQVMGKWVKRKPLPDGTLPLTDKEKEEFINLILWHRHYDLESIAVVDDLLTIGRSNNGIHCDYVFSHSVKAILYLANLFDLEV